MKFGTSNDAGKDATALHAAVRRQNNMGDQSALIVTNSAATGDPGDPVAIDARAANTAIAAQGGRIGLFSRCLDNGEFGLFAGGPVGIYASSSKGLAGLAGQFFGGVHVLGLLNKAGGGFKIDHPLDPENSIWLTRSLSHPMPSMSIATTW